MRSLAFTLLAIAGLAGNYACKVAFGEYEFLCSLMIVVGVFGLVFTDGERR